MDFLDKDPPFLLERPFDDDRKERKREFTHTLKDGQKVTEDVPLAREPGHDPKNPHASRGMIEYLINKTAKTH